jgi:TATA-binding protein-associated factor Taf7
LLLPTLEKRRHGDNDNDNDENDDFLEEDEAKIEKDDETERTRQTEREAYFFTKPLQGSIFRKFRDVMSGTNMSTPCLTMERSHQAKSVLEVIILERTTIVPMVPITESILGGRGSV